MQKRRVFMIDTAIRKLVIYGLETGLLTKEDEVYTRNVRLCLSK